MKNIAIPATIAPAMKPEMFDATETPRSNVMYFFYKSTGDKSFHGPFYMHDGFDIVELDCQLRDGMIYTLAQGMEEGFTFLLNLRPAHADDLKDGKNLRRGYLYYIREEVDFVDGPFALTSNTDIELLAMNLRANKIFVPAKEQTFTPYSAQHSA
jgi:hypothetical protein